MVAIITRDEVVKNIAKAISLGDAHYFGGKCPNCGGRLWYIRENKCKSCKDRRTREWVMRTGWHKTPEQRARSRKNQKDAYARDPEHIKLKNRLAYHKDNERRRALRKARRERVKDKINARNRALRKTNPEKFRKQYRNSYLKNYAKLVERNRRRRALQYGAEGTFTFKDVRLIFDKQHGLCANSYCGKKLVKYHVDHIHPLVRGGSNWPDNLQCLCPSCNNSKGAQTMVEFMAKKAAEAVVSTFDGLKAAKARYKKVSYTDAEGKKRSANISGDAVSRALVGATKEDLVKALKGAKCGPEAVDKLENAANFGAGKMAVSNRLRALVKGGQTIFIRGVEISSLTDAVETPVAKKPRAKKAA